MYSCSPLCVSIIDCSRFQREEARKRQEEAEALAAERRKARETALEWTKDIKVDSEEEKEKKPKKQRRVKTEAGSGNEGEAESPKKRRRSKLKRMGVDSGSEREGLFTDDEEGGGTDSKPAKKVCHDLRFAHTILKVCLPSAHRRNA